MKDTYAMNATNVRKEWSSVIDRVVRERPQFIRRTRDEMILISLSHFESALADYTFSAQRMVENDDSITLSLNEIDLVENAVDESSAIRALAKSILEYAEDYYNGFSLYSIAPNRKEHIPYVLKALILNNPEKIEKLITVCNDVGNKSSFTT